MISWWFEWYKEGSKGSEFLTFDDAETPLLASTGWKRSFPAVHVSVTECGSMAVQRESIFRAGFM
jgi:hypothetical protein